MFQFKQTNNIDRLLAAVYSGQGSRTFFGLIQGADTHDFPDVGPLPESV